MSHRYLPIHQTRHLSLCLEPLARHPLPLPTEFDLLCSNQFRVHQLELIHTRITKYISLRVVSPQYTVFRSSLLSCRHHFVRPTLYVALIAEPVRILAHIRVRTGVQAVVVGL